MRNRTKTLIKKIIVLLKNNQMPMKLSEIYCLLEKDDFFLGMTREVREANIRRSIYLYCFDREIKKPENDFIFYPLLPKGTRGQAFGLYEWRETDYLLKSRNVNYRNSREMNVYKEKTGFICEFAHLIGEEHTTFTCQSNMKEFVEVHHIVPMEYQSIVGEDINNHNNLVALCPICHAQLHYGLILDKERILEYILRGRDLNSLGLSVEETQYILSEYYGT